MYIAENTLDDLLHEVFQNLMDDGVRVQASKGWNRELTGVLLEIRNPRARLSRTVTKGTIFSCLGETLWYLAGTNKLDFIKYYLPQYGEFSDDGLTVHGGYGPRLFRMRGAINQLSNVIELLRRKRSSRQAVIQLFNAEDILRNYKDIPCTCTLQFLIRNKKLHMVSHMRSNDAFRGLPHDVFAFTMIQEIVARTLDVTLGSYKHSVSSLHLYYRDLSKVKRYLKEGWQLQIPMRAMPRGDPWRCLRKILEAEQKIRDGRPVKVGALGLPNYWNDIVRLLLIYSNRRDKSELLRLKRQMASAVYAPYIDKRIASIR